MEKHVNKRENISFQDLKNDMFILSFYDINFDIKNLVDKYGYHISDNKWIFPSSSKEFLNRYLNFLPLQHKYHREKSFTEYNSDNSDNEE